MHPGGGVFVAADVHYLASGGARAAAVVAPDAAFSRLAADRIALVPGAEPYQPAGSTAANSRHCTRSWRASPTSPCSSSTATSPWTRPAGQVSAHTPTQNSASRSSEWPRPLHPATHAILSGRGTAARPLYVTASGIPD